MPQLRRDPTSKRWVIVAPERRNRPREEGRAQCPFCPGNEALTPPAIPLRSEGGETEGTWRLRVFPNRYPAVRETTLPRLAEGLLRQIEGYGFHEVLVESPEHSATLATLPLERIEAICRALQERVAALARQPGIRYVQVFKNHGRAAGASLLHPHSQIVALPLLPLELLQKLEVYREHRREQGGCLYCELIARERAGERIVFENRSVLVLSSYAARIPYETVILPKGHFRSFPLFPFVDGLAEGIARLFRMYDRRLGAVPYNLWFVDGPAEPEEDFHWHIEVSPLTSPIGGFERSTGFSINTCTPEEAARELRGDHAA